MHPYYEVTLSTAPLCTCALAGSGRPSTLRWLPARARLSARLHLLCLQVSLTDCQELLPYDCREREAKRAEMAAREGALERQLRQLHTWDTQLAAKQRQIREYTELVRVGVGVCVMK